MFLDEKALVDDCRKDVNLLSIEAFQAKNPIGRLCDSTLNFVLIWFVYDCQKEVSRNGVETHVHLDINKRT